jgi:hypothetical protein
MIKTECAAPLRLRTHHQVTLQIPGFERSEKDRTVVQYSLEAYSSEQWYRRVTQRIVDRLGKGYFPIFRFSDGECYFCLGYRMPAPQPGSSFLYHYLRTVVSAYGKYRCHNTFWSGLPGYGHEVYRRRKWRELRPVFTEQLRDIAGSGMIAANFCKHHVPGMIDRYIPDILDWFDAEKIRLDSDNYVPFYFIYGMLLGPNRHHFLKRRNILVITSLTLLKETRLRAYFESAGVGSVKFIPISRSHSMSDRIELRPEHTRTDLVLVGAGVGAANILSQVKSLNALSIDAGYVLECYQDPSHKGIRVFTLPDEELLEEPGASLDGETPTSQR